MEDSRLLWVVLAYMWPGATQQHICDQEQVSNTYMVGGKSATSGGLTGLRVLLGCSWGVLGRSWGFLGRSLRVSRDLGEILGGHKVLMEAPGAPKGCPKGGIWGGKMAPKSIRKRGRNLRAKKIPFQTVLGPSWSRLGSILGHLDRA